MRPLAPLLVLAAVAGCLSAPEPAAQAGPAPGVEVLEPLPEGAPTFPGVFETLIVDGAFEHPRIHVGAPATFAWVNVDAQTHGLEFENATLPDASLLPPGARFTVTFDRTGDFAYRCPYHADMTGIVIVR